MYGSRSFTDALRTVHESPGCGTGPRLKNQFEREPAGAKRVAERHRVHAVPRPVGLLRRTSCAAGSPRRRQPAARCRRGSRADRPSTMSFHHRDDGSSMIGVEADVALGGAVLEQLLEDRRVELVGKRPAPQRAHERLVERHDRPAVDLADPTAAAGRCRRARRRRPWRSAATWPRPRRRQGSDRPRADCTSI